MKTKLQHIATLPQPYRAAAMEYLKDRPRAANMKHRSLYWALVWTLPAGELNRNKFWSQLFTNHNCRLAINPNNTLAIN